MTSYFDDMTTQYINLTKMHKSGVNRVVKARADNSSEGRRL
jgi:hypothetical protein